MVVSSILQCQKIIHSHMILNRSMFLFKHRMWICFCHDHGLHTGIHWRKTEWKHKFTVILLSPKGYVVEGPVFNSRPLHVCVGDVADVVLLLHIHLLLPILWGWSCRAWWRRRRWRSMSNPGFWSSRRTLTSFTIQDLSVLKSAAMKLQGRLSLPLSETWVAPT